MNFSCMQVVLGLYCINYYLYNICWCILLLVITMLFLGQFSSDAQSKGHINFLSSILCWMIVYMVLALVQVVIQNCVCILSIICIFVKILEMFRSAVMFSTSSAEKKQKKLNTKPTKFWNNAPSLRSVGTYLKLWLLYENKMEIIS